MQVITVGELAKHKAEDDCWIAIDGKVYDISTFAAGHPGGEKILLAEAGTDATAKFHAFHNSQVLAKYGPKLQIGVLDTLNKVKPKAVQDGSFGDLVPYADPYWYQSFNTAYYNDSHRKWRAHVRAFVEAEFIPYVNAWDEAGQSAGQSEEPYLPREVYRKAGKAGILAGVVGAPWCELAGIPGPENYDNFHELILYDELGRVGSGGVTWGIYEGLCIGLPPVLLFGSDYLKKKVARDCLMGEKFICLCVSEPWAGSDVAGLQTTARREGDFFIVNGAKKWITNGMWADYFTVAVRTGEGQNALSMLLLEKGMEGITLTKMKCMGVWGSGTAYIVFENVKVPVANLIGVEGDAFKMMMYNFNHERWGFCVQANRFARICFEDAFKFALKRKTFGKPLAEHQMLRFKFAEMARQIESSAAWIEQLTYQMMTMSKQESNTKLGGPIALCKAHCTKVFEYCARESAQIFGGAAYVRGGVGERVERLYRDVRAWAIPGGSEEILLDFAVRQAIRVATTQAKL